MSAFFNGCININHVNRQHCLLDRDDQRVCMAQFLRESLFLRDNVGRYGCLTVLNRSEISCIVCYVATDILHILNNKLLRILQQQAPLTPIYQLYNTFNTLPIHLLYKQKNIGTGTLFNVS